MNIQFQSAVIFVKDIQISRKFYEDVLNQTVIIDHGPNVGFESGFAIWEAKHANQVIGNHATPEPLGQNNLELYFESPELDAVLERFNETDTPFVHDIQEQPWGQRVLRVFDPDGHIVEVGEPMPIVILRFASQGLSVIEIAERSSMPVEIVKQIIDSVA